MVGRVGARRRRAAARRGRPIGLTHMSRAAARDRRRGRAARQAGDAERIAAAAELAAEGTEPPADLNASQDYKRHLARVLAGAPSRSGAQHERSCTRTD